MEGRRSRPGPLVPDGATGPVALRMLLGAHLRRLREEAGVSRAEAAHLIRGSEAKLSRMESGKVGFKRRDVEDLLERYGGTGEEERRELVVLARRTTEPGWWQPYSDAIPEWFCTFVGLEQDASAIRTYESQFVPGLLQTEDYARAVIELGRPGPVAEIDRRVALRMGRQQVLQARCPPAFWAVIDEAALHRPMGGGRTMRAQLEHLAALTELPNVTLQLLPLHQGGAAAAGPFILLRFADTDLPDLVYLEQLTGAQYLDRTADVETYRVLIDRLAAAALTPQRSRAMLASLRARY